MNKQEKFYSIIGEKKDDLTERELVILAARAGVVGEPMTLEAIGSEVMLAFGYTLTKERIRVILERISRVLGGRTWLRLGLEFPVLVDGRRPPDRGSERYKKKVASAVRHAAKGAMSPVSYVGVVLDEAGVELPGHRKMKEVAAMDHLQACKALYEDFGVVRFGDYRVCSHCQKPLPVSEYYVFKDGRVYHNCKACNTVICRENRKKVEGNSGSVGERDSGSDSGTDGEVQETS